MKLLEKINKHNEHTILTHYPFVTPRRVIKSELNRYQTRAHSAHAIASALALSKTTLVHGGDNVPCEK
jgi:hypothetical protein